MLLNVRLSGADTALVRRLQRRGLVLSTIVREALRQAAANQPTTRLSEVVRSIHAAHPTSRRSTKRPALDDRRAVASHIAATLRARR